MSTAIQDLVLHFVRVHLDKKTVEETEIGRAVLNVFKESRQVTSEQEYAELYQWLHKNIFEIQKSDMQLPKKKMHILYFMYFLFGHCFSNIVHLARFQNQNNEKTAADRLKQKSAGAVELGKYYLRSSELKEIQETDEKQAIEWFKIASKGDDKKGHYHLAKMYLDLNKYPWITLSRKQRVEQGLNLLLSAGQPQHRDVNAQYELGNLYDKGILIVKDEQLALYWYNKAQHQGHTEAAKAYARLNKDLNGTNGSVINYITSKLKTIKKYNNHFDTIIDELQDNENRPLLENDLEVEEKPESAQKTKAESKVNGEMQPVQAIKNNQVTLSNQTLLLSQTALSVNNVQSVQAAKSVQNVIIHAYLSEYCLTDTKVLENEYKIWLEALHKNDSILRFYKTLRLKLHNFFHGSQAAASDLVKKEENTMNHKLASKIKGLGDIIPFGIAKPLFEVLTDRLTKKGDAEISDLVERASEIALSFDPQKFDYFICAIARGVALRYESQIKKLKLDSARELACIVVKYIEKYIQSVDSKKLFDNSIQSSSRCGLSNLELKENREQNTFLEQFLEGITNLKFSMRVFKLSKMFGHKVQLETREKITVNGKAINDWTYEGVLQRSGFKVLSFNNTVSPNKDHTLFSFKFYGILEDKQGEYEKHEKYGFRFIDEQIFNAMLQTPALHGRVIAIEEFASAKERSKQEPLNSVNPLDPLNTLDAKSIEEELHLQNLHIRLELEKLTKLPEVNAKCGGL